MCIKGSQLLEEGNPSAFISSSWREEEEVTMRGRGRGRSWLAAQNTITTPSIRSPTNYIHLKLSTQANPDWMGNTLSLVTLLWTPSILHKLSLTLNPCPYLGMVKAKLWTAITREPFELETWNSGCRLILTLRISQRLQPTTPPDVEAIIVGEKGTLKTS